MEEHRKRKARGGNAVRVHPAFPFAVIIPVDLNGLIEATSTWANRQTHFLPALRAHLRYMYKAKRERKSNSGNSGRRSQQQFSAQVQIARNVCRHDAHNPFLQI